MKATRDMPASTSLGNHGAGVQNAHAGRGTQNNNNASGIQNNFETQRMSQNIFVSTAAHYQALKERDEILNSLSFANLDARKLDIDPAHRHTCKWLFETKQFRYWQDRRDLPTHKGVLWIKGNPGAGKSTLMKYTLEHCWKMFKNPVIVNYFFNARGSGLEKSPLGMLRSLIYQLLRDDPGSLKRFIPVFRDKKGKDATLTWREAELSGFLLNEMTVGRRGSLVILIDALDECNEPDARGVVRLLEQLSDRAMSANVVLNICLSSRHYPTISMAKSLNVRLEDMEEHSRDIQLYVQDKLRGGNSGMKNRVIQMASGIFMWVILVVALLNQAFDRGRVEEMQRILDEVPRDLEDLFTTLLSQISENREETVLMFQWVLFSKVPLRPEDLFVGSIAGTRPNNLGAWNPSTIKLDDMRRRITHSSMGLIEFRKGAEQVQFIHKSVNDFLLRNHRLRTLHPTLESNPIGTSHERLKQCCLEWLKVLEFGKHPQKQQQTMLTKKFFYPLFRYCAVNIFYHAEEAQARDIEQDEFLQFFHQNPAYLEKLQLDQNLLCFLSTHGHVELVKMYVPRKGVNLNAPGVAGWNGTVVQAALVAGHTEIAKILLERGADPNAQGGKYGNALNAALHIRDKSIVKTLLDKGANPNTRGKHGNILQTAAVYGYVNIVQMLLEKGADPNIHGGEYGSALNAAIDKNAKEIVKLLLDKGADPNYPGKHGCPLEVALLNKQQDIAKVLLNKGADPNVEGGKYGSLLQAASAYGYRETVQMLLEKGANPNKQGGKYGNALQAALRNKHTVTAKLLLDKGANPNAPGGTYGHALQTAAMNGDMEMAKTLLEKGARLNTQGGKHGNALQAALHSKQSSITKMLLEKGADPNSRGGKFGNALQAAAVQGDVEIVKMLLEKGADPDAEGKYRSAVEAAARHRQRNVARLLRERTKDTSDGKGEKSPPKISRRGKSSPRSSRRSEARLSCIIL